MITNFSVPQIQNMVRADVFLRVLLRFLSVRLRRLSDFSRGAFIAACDGENGSHYFENTGHFIQTIDLLSKNSRLHAMELNEVRLKKILKTERQEYQRYLGIISEDFSDKLKLIAESVLGIQKQLIALRDMVAKNTEDIEIMKMDIETMKRDGAIMKMDLTSIKHAIKKKVDEDEFAILEKRVTLLERHR